MQKTNQNQNNPTLNPIETRGEAAQRLTERAARPKALGSEAFTPQAFTRVREQVERMKREKKEFLEAEKERKQLECARRYMEVVERNEEKYKKKYGDDYEPPTEPPFMEKKSTKWTNVPLIWPSEQEDIERWAAAQEVLNSAAAVALSPVRPTFESLKLFFPICGVRTEWVSPMLLDGAFRYSSEPPYIGTFSSIVQDTKGFL